MLGVDLVLIVGIVLAAVEKLELRVTLLLVLCHLLEVRPIAGDELCQLIYNVSQFYV